MDSSASDNESSDDERLAIRDELKSLSFEELLKLKQEVGLKYYSSKVFKSDQKDCTNKKLHGSKSSNKDIFKRGNKNRPREESSKVPVKSLLKVSSKKEFQGRDPRFDSLCGDYSENAFMKNYSFVDSVRDKEIKELGRMYKREKDSEEKEKIKSALQSMKNRQQSRKAREAKLKEKQSERERNLQLLKEGKKPHFMKKGEKKALHLIDKYEELKSEKKLEKYIKKKNKDQARKSLKQLP